MKRSISVTLVGIVALMGSLFTLLGIFAAAVFTFSSAFNPDMSVPGAKAGGLIGLAFLLLLSIWGIATGIGVFFLKGWARISIIVFGVFVIFVGFFGGVTILMMPLHSSGPNAVDAFMAIKAAIAAFYLLIGAIGLWWVLLFNSRSVKTQFASDHLVEDARPVSISIIAWLFIVGCLFLPLSLVMRWPMVFLGLLLTGRTAAFMFALLTVFQFYVGMGLLRLNPRSRVLAIYYSVWGALNGILLYALPGREARLGAMMKAIPTHFDQPTPSITSIPYWPIEVMILAIMIIQVYFLITRKPAFYSSPPLAGAKVD